MDRSRSRGVRGFPELLADPTQTLPSLVELGRTLHVHGPQSTKRARAHGQFFGKQTRPEIRSVKLRSVKSSVPRILIRPVIPL
jgi:hypothetical protein